MFHKNSDDYIDEDELRHENEDDEEKRREVGRDAAIPETVIATVALFSQCVFHDSVPVIAWTNKNVLFKSQNLFCQNFEPVAILNKVRKAIPKDLK